MPEHFIPPHGGYENLLSFQKARIVYDGTVRFCDRFIDKRSRTHDQMVQAARSGKQNILEGSHASATSKETEIKLTERSPLQPGGITRRLPRFPPFARHSGMAQRPLPHTAPPTN